MPGGRLLVLLAALLLGEDAGRAVGSDGVLGWVESDDTAGDVVSERQSTGRESPGPEPCSADAGSGLQCTGLGITTQAIAHVDAMLCVRPELDEIVVSSRIGTYADAAGCDIVCTATRSSEALVTAAMVRPGTHLNAVGAYRTDMRELSADLVAAATVVVDDVHAAHHEAGDLALAVAEAGWSWDRLAGDLAAVASGQLTRSSDIEITVFKSVGLAVEDLVIARIVASAQNLI